MPATAQPLPQASPVSLDLNPPVRAESIDLRALIGHQTATQAGASVESVTDFFKTGSANFVAVLENQRLLGMCSRQETAALLGGRYGFSLWARKPIRIIFANKRRASRSACQSAMCCAPCGFDLRKYS